MKVLEYDGPTPYPLICEPNQAFTPRQIVEQFARQELSANVFDSTDSIDSDSYSDEQMASGVIDFEDEFEAIDYMKNTKVVKDEPKKDESTKDSDSGDDESQEDSAD